MKTIEVIYAGQRVTSDHKISHKYFALDKSENFNFSKRIHGLEILGTKLTITHKGGNSYGDFKIIGPAEEGDNYFDEITNWSLLSRAASDEIKTIQLNKRPHSKSLEAIVDDLRSEIKAYNINTRQRNDIALWVYNRLTKL